MPGAVAEAKTAAMDNAVDVWRVKSASRLHGPLARRSGGQLITAWSWFDSRTVHQMPKLTAYRDVRGCTTAERGRLPSAGPDTGKGGRGVGGAKIPALQVSAICVRVAEALPLHPGIERLQVTRLARCVPSSRCKRRLETMDRVLDTCEAQDQGGGRKSAVHDHGSPTMAGFIRGRKQSRRGFYPPAVLYLWVACMGGSFVWR